MQITRSPAYHDLSSNERTVFDALYAAAIAGLPCPKTEDLMGKINVSSTSTVPKIIRRLENAGLLSVKRYQRTRQVCVGDVCTAQPDNTAPHWRDRPANTPAPARSTVMRADPELSKLIFAEATELGKTPQAFLCDLVFLGWEVHKEAW